MWRFYSIFSMCLHRALRSIFCITSAISVHSHCVTSTTLYALCSCKELSGFRQALDAYTYLGTYPCIVSIFHVLRFAILQWIDTITFFRTTIEVVIFSVIFKVYRNIHIGRSVGWYSRLDLLVSYVSIPC